MNKPKIAITIIALLAIFIVGKMLYSSWRDNRLEKETVLRTESEMRFKQLAKEVVTLKLKRDSLVVLTQAMDSIISHQKNNPSIIIKKYENLHINIDNLDNVNSIVLFSNNLDKYSKNRERYSLSRFNRGH